MWRWATLLVGAIATTANSNVIRIPSQQPTIQAGMEVAGVCDTLLLAPGTYTGAANHGLYPYNCLTIMSEDGAEATIVELENDFFATIFVEDGWGDAEIRVEGLTLRGGRPAIQIGYCGAGAPQIRHCIFEQNDLGVGAFGEPSKSVVDSCVFRGNRTGLMVSTGGVTHTVRGNLFVQNGTALDLASAFNTLVSGNVMAGNTLGIISNLPATLIRNVIYANTNGVSVSSQADFQCNDVFGNDTDYKDCTPRTGELGNISVDPLFCDPTLASGTGVHPQSPLLPTANECGMNIGAVSIACTCCLGRVGDANGSGEDEPTIGDVSAMISANFIIGNCENTIPCLFEADINQSGGMNPNCDDISIGDISTLIDYLFITGKDRMILPACL